MNTRKLTYTFQCPVCSKFFRMDEPGEPVCSGPSEMRDDHPHEVMRLVKIQAKEVRPDYAAMRAEGRLLIPGDVESDKVLSMESRLVIP